MMKGILYLEDGSKYEGMGFGEVGTSIGELVFNTSMTGYQEVITDPSYAGQIITMTYPLIGNYGINSYENESRNIYAKGLVTKSICSSPSNYMSEDSINDMLKHHGVVGVCDVDTRSITRKIRNSGTIKCAITNEELSEEELYKLLNKTQLRNDWMKRVGTKEMIHINGNGPRIVLIDFGVKDNMVNSLMKKDCDITIMPYDTKYDEILQINPQGVLLSNGPGDPKEAFEAIELIKKVIQKYPTFGICMGHQILAHAIGGNTYKMKFGHRGGNHAVYDIESDRAYITSQNHGYSVDADSIKDKNMTITHINLNDNTVEGMSHKSLPVFSVQFHPEGSPGPEDSGYLFDKFINYMKGA